MASVPPGDRSDRLTDDRPGRGSRPSVAGRSRAGSPRRWLWTSGVAAAVIGAGLVAPSLTAAGAPTPGPGAEQVLSERAATATALLTKPRRPVPTIPTGTTTAPTTTAPTTTAPTTTAPTTTAPTTTAPTTTAPTTTDSPLAGDTFHGTNAGAAAAAAQPGTSPEDAALLRELAGVPTATWLGSWSGDVTATVSRVVADARAAGRVPVFVAYNIPGRDCGGYSSGGVDSAAQYDQWVRGIAGGIGSAEVVVVVEPDALAQLCGDPAARTAMLRAAVEVLERNPGTHTYLDAGHSTWVDAATMADRLRAAGATGADGFALNVSNFHTTASNVTYGQQVSSLLGGVHFVVDTSRNGNGPGSDWCNPPGRAVGQRPTGSTGQLRVDAYLWVKTPGESDGTCNGGPAAGTFWPSYAVALMRAAA
ncbi:glycoside hydrolase family 6 protein [Geodermatophilus maliterrae]|uniref:Glucanase n=1 Tax=Geodermatophilus maliterrae TaxID=3162531 RepID=A0ABV3XK07_9ACTN